MNGGVIVILVMVEMAVVKAQAHAIISRIADIVILSIVLTNQANKRPTSSRPFIHMDYVVCPLSTKSLFEQA